MMVGKRYYSEADMMRMQRSAEERVREMQERVRQTTRDYGDGAPPMPSFVNPNRNWNTGPNTRNGRGQGQRQQGGADNRQNRNESRNRSDGQDGRRLEDDSANRQEAPPSREKQPRHTPASPAEEAGKGTTVLDDIIGSLGLESDTLLIIGLLLILINQKADTTLILALAYLLF